VNTLFLASTDAEAFENLFASALGSTILAPEQAAAVATCVQESHSDFARFGAGAEYLIGERKIVRRRSFLSDDGFLRSRERAAELREILEVSRKLQPEVSKHQGNVIRPEDLLDRFHLDQLGAGLYVPQRTKLVIAKSMDEAIRLAQSDKTSVLDMSPRRFEEFLAELFVRLGYEVELTQATRDGGADLLCLRNLNGIPFRFAVEIKRYKEGRNIDVSLVRAFVGANEEHRANQLVYVTTSAYTKPAVEYANKCKPYFLNLKKYDQVQEWCKAALAEPTRLL